MYQVREVYRCVLHTILFNRAVGWVKPREVECEVLSRTTYPRIDDPALIRTVDKNVDALYALIEKAALARTPHTVTTITGLTPPPSSSSPSSPSSSRLNTSLTSTSTSSSPSHHSSSPHHHPQQQPPPPPPIPASLTLSFYESTPSKSWFGPAVQKLYWERWHLPALIHFHKHTTHRAGTGTGVGGGGGGGGGGREERQEERFRLVMMSVVTLMNEKRDHLPTVKGGMEGLTYSFECETECAGLGTGGGGAGEGGGGGGMGGVGDDGGWGLSSMMKKVFKEGPPLLIPK